MMRMPTGRWSRRAVLGGLLGSAAGLARAQTNGAGFAGMGAAADDYAQVRPGLTLRFPDDHAPHPAFRIEWWYVTAALRDLDDGAPLGVQWTLFRNALAPQDDGQGWDSMQLWMGHAAATSAQTHVAAERFARGGIGQAGVETAPFHAWIDDWSLRGADRSFDAMRMTATEPAFDFDLSLTAQGPLVLHGDSGFSRKAERGQASYYYSQPFYAAEGQLRLDGRRRRVGGHAWLDREWSSQPLDPDQTGWDWFSIVLDDGDRVMLYRIRHAQGRDTFTGTWIHRDGRTETLPDGAADLTPTGHADVAGRRTPVRWSLAVPAKGFQAQTEPVNPQAWNALRVPYWEGPIRVIGDRPGEGYLEMTGY